jgi:hypothetical protein
MKRLLCFIGFHDWEPDPGVEHSVFTTVHRARCRRCLAKSLWHLGDRVG